MIHHRFTCWSNFRPRYIKKPQWQDLKQPGSHAPVQIRCNYKPYLGAEHWNSMPSFTLSCSFFFFWAAFADLFFPCFICFQFSSCTLKVFPNTTNKQLNYTFFHVNVLHHTLTTHTGSCDSSYCLVVLPACHSLQYKGMFRAVWNWLVIKVRENEFGEKNRYRWRVDWVWEQDHHQWVVYRMC